MRKSAALLLAVPLLLAACSSTPEARGPGQGGDPFADQSVNGAVPEDNGAGVPAGSVDCASISQQQLLAFGYGVQTLAQLDNQAAVDAVNEGTANFSTEAFDDSLHALSTLDGHAVDPYGDPADALAYYADVSAAAANLLAYDTPIPDGEFTKYTETTGGAAQVIGAQSPISASYNAYCAS